MGRIIVGYGAHQPGATYVYTVEKQPNFTTGPVIGIWETVDVFIGTEEGKRLAFERLDRLEATYGKSDMVLVARVARRQVIDR